MEFLVNHSRDEIIRIQDHGHMEIALSLKYAFDTNPTWLRTDYIELYMPNLCVEPVLLQYIITGRYQISLNDAKAILSEPAYAEFIKNNHGSSN